MTTCPFFDQSCEFQCWLSPWFDATKKSLVDVKGCRNTMSFKMKQEQRQVSYLVSRQRVGDGIKPCLLLQDQAEFWVPLTISYMYTKAGVGDWSRSF